MLSPLELPVTVTDEAALLQSTAFIESDAPEVIRFAREAVSDAKNDLEKGVMIY